MLGSELVGIGGVLMLGAIPIGLFIGLVLWAFGTRFPMALLIAIILIPVTFGLGVNLVGDGNVKKVQEQRSAYQKTYVAPTPAGYKSKPYTPGTAN